VAREAKFLFWLRLPRKSGLGINMELTWPSQACQAWPGHIFLVSLAKNPESPAWPGFARLARFLAGTFKNVFLLWIPF